jgi:GxxExxY protein
VVILWYVDGAETENRSLSVSSVMSFDGQIGGFRGEVNQRLCTDSREVSVSAENQHTELISRIIGAFFRVYNCLGYGFSEEVYENALVLELRKMNVQAEQQEPITVYYDDQVVGQYYADIVVDGTVILELKAVDALLPEHEAQLLNYLKATSVEIGLLLNFGPTPEVKRIVYDHQSKGSLGWMQEPGTDGEP